MQGAKRISVWPHHRRMLSHEDMINPITFQRHVLWMSSGTAHSLKHCKTEGVCRGPGHTWRWHIRVMKLCAMLKEARNCMVTLTDWPMDRVESSPSSSSHEHNFSDLVCTSHSVG